MSKRYGKLEIRVSRARLADMQDHRSPRLGPAPGHCIRTAYCSQLSVRRDHSPRPLGAALMGIGTSEARGWGRKAGSRRCSTTFRPQAIRSSLRRHLNCRHECGARNLSRRRSERLTSATAAHGGQGVRQVDPESPGLGPRGHRAPATMTRTAARRWHLGGPLLLAVSTAHSLGPTRCCPSGFGILGS